MMEKRLSLLAITALVTLTSPTQSLPEAPVNACDDLRLQHGSPPQTTDPPYELHVEMFKDIAVPGTQATYSYMPNMSYNRKPSRIYST